MKRKWFTLVGCLAVVTGYAQWWTPSGSNIYNTNTGSVGIGTSSPSSKLHVNGGTLKVQTSSGTVEIGAQNTIFTHFISSTPAFFFSGEVHVQGGLVKSYGSPLQLWAEDMRGLTMSNNNGFVGIGVNDPKTRLDVAGDIQISNSAVPMGLITEFPGGPSPILNMSLNFRESTKQTAYRGAAFRIDPRDGSPLFQWLSRKKNTTTDGVLMTLTEDGNMGVGTTNPETTLHVATGVMSLDGTTPTIYTGSGTGELSRYLLVSNSPTTPTSSGLKAGGLLVSDAYNYANPSKNDLVVKGYVGIGMPLTSNPNDYRLAVNGRIGAKEVRVEKNTTPWPDYVFRNEYRLPALLEVEKFIVANSHLQDVPSAAEVEKDGHDLGEMDAILLKKIEELTLYAIEQQKRMEQQQAEIDALKEMIKRKK